jgi:8-oxo-dGTP pyrophosphatase MutT (NUDIX family)
MPRPPDPQGRGRLRRARGAHLSDAAESLRPRLITAEEAEARADAVHGDTDAAVLLPLYDWPDDPGLIFTERRGDLRRHAGEISFPGGRHDDGDSSFCETALREAEEEISLRREDVEVAGALPPVGTFVTGYRVFPFVGLVPPDLPLIASPEEVEQILRFRISDLRGGYEKRRLVRRGVPIKTDTYVVGETLIWGATARILGDFLAHLDQSA